ncbi:MAG: DUF4249 domain-containing protein [Bacteroidales bacterium]|nr:DUF4249 domain-containing protein [Bacteroidales bacterium]
MLKSSVSNPVKSQAIIRLICWITIIAAPLVVISCEDIMDVSFTNDSGRDLVVEGSITTDVQAHRVTLSFTGDYFQKSLREMATGAEVSISDGDSTFQLHELSDGEYYTEADVQGETGKTYTLNVKLADGKMFTASEKMLPCTDFDSISQSLNHQFYDGDYGYDVLFYGKEPEPLGHSYMYLLYINSILYTDSLSELSFANDDFVNGKYIRDYIVYRIREGDIHPGYDWVTLEMHSISPAYYDYLSAMLLETVWKGSPWDGPPASVNGNINNGAKGYFRASEVKRKSRRFAILPRANK